MRICSLLEYTRGQTLANRTKQPGPSFQVQKQLLLCCLLLLLNKTTKLKVENSAQRAGSPVRYCAPRYTSGLNCAHLSVKFRTRAWSLFRPKIHISKISGIFARISGRRFTQPDQAGATVDQLANGY